MEEKDIKIIEDFNYNFLSQTRLKRDMPVTMYITDEIHNVIMKLLDAYRFEKVVKEEVEELLENSIPKERIQEKIYELYTEDRQWTSELEEPNNDFKNIDRNLKRIKNQIDILKELLEE